MSGSIGDVEPLRVGASERGEHGAEGPMDGHGQVLDAGDLDAGHRFVALRADLGEAGFEPGGRGPSACSVSIRGALPRVAKARKMWPEPVLTRLPTRLPTRIETFQ